MFRELLSVQIGVAMAKEKKPAAARAALDAVFATARQNLADLAAHDVFGGDSLKHALNPNSLLETPLAQHALNFTDQVGTYLASLLPDHLGPFPINHSYIQARDPCVPARAALSRTAAAGWHGLSS